ATATPTHRDRRHGALSTRRVSVPPRGHTPSRSCVLLAPMSRPLLAVQRVIGVRESSPSAVLPLVSLGLLLGDDPVTPDLLRVQCAAQDLSAQTADALQPETGGQLWQCHVPLHGR